VALQGVDGYVYKEQVTPEKLEACKVKLVDELIVKQTAQDAKTKAAAEVKAACENHQAVLNARLAPMKQQCAVVQLAAEEKFNELMRHTLTAEVELRCVWLIPRCTNGESHETRRPKLPCRGKRCLHAAA
jgi:uncharacterized membrane-anchored protein YjiN (DUF445 family)